MSGRTNRYEPLLVCEDGDDYLAGGHVPGSGLENMIFSYYDRIYVRPYSGLGVGDTQHQFQQNIFYLQVWYRKREM